MSKQFITKKMQLKLVRNLKYLNHKSSRFQSRGKILKRRVLDARKLFKNQNYVKYMEYWGNANRINMKIFKTLKKPSRKCISTIEERIALSLLNHSHNAYKFLSQVIDLPSYRSLFKALNKFYLNEDINKMLMEQLKTAGEKMTTHCRLCVLAFDEIPLKAHVKLNHCKDRISGIITDKEEDTPLIADYAQVYLIRGITKNYKQPIGYTLSSEPIQSIELAKQLKAIISDLQHANFTVIATVCDHSTNNRTAIKMLNEETRLNYMQDEKESVLKDNIFYVGFSEIIAIYDPPHLIKGMRNNFMTNDLNHQIKGYLATAKWDHLEQLYEEDLDPSSYSLLSTLTPTHVIPSRIRKTEVKYATQLFGEKFAAPLGFLSTNNYLPQECEQTGEFLSFMNNLFDSVNGSDLGYEHRQEILRGPVTPTSIHKQRWRDFKATLQSFEFINNHTNEKENVPIFKCWITTLEGLEDIVLKLEREYQINLVWMRRFNMDPLENFFGAIRAFAPPKRNVTPDEFESAFVTLLLHNRKNYHPPRANCQRDKAEPLFSLNIKSNKDRLEGPTCMLDINDMHGIPFIPKRDRVSIGTLAFASWVIVQKAREKWKDCELCIRCIAMTNISRFPNARKILRRRYCAFLPTPMVLDTVSHIQDITNYLLKKHINRPAIQQYANLVVRNMVNLNYITCPTHKNNLKEFVISHGVQFFIFLYCENTNKVIYGKKCVTDPSDPVQKLAQEYCNRFIKIIR